MNWATREEVERERGPSWTGWRAFLALVVFFAGLALVGGADVNRSRVHPANAADR
jgi:hypothetical protein